MNTTHGHGSTIAGHPRTLVLFGVPFHDVTFDETLAWCVARMKNGPPACMATANVDFLMQATRDPELQRILLEADLVIADGQPIVTLSGKFGPPLRERVTGSDLTPMLASACAREGLSIFLLGGAPGVAEKAASILVERNPGLHIAGTYSPPLAGILQMNHEEILVRLRAAKPDLLLVAFGAPKQEKFINLHLRSWQIPLSIGIGGTLDFLAGAQTRAPRWVQKIGFEWLWRMGTNPKRLFRRYAENIGFLVQTVSRQRRLLRSEAGKALTPGPPSEWSLLEPASLSEQRVLLFSLGSRNRLSSEELGRLVHAEAAMRRRDGRLVVYGGTTRVERIIREAGLTSYLEYRPDRTQAEARCSELESTNNQGVVTVKGAELNLRLPAELNVTTLPDWVARVEQAWSEKLTRISVDASELTFMDSASLGWLATLRKRCQDGKLEFACCGFSGAPLQTLRLARMEKYFQSGS